MNPYVPSKLAADVTVCVGKVARDRLPGYFGEPEGAKEPDLSDPAVSSG